MKVTEKSAPEEIAASGAEKPPYKGKIKRLPPDLRAEFDRRLVAGAFSDYRGLARWLRENGYSISHTALARYGRALDRKLEALKLATEQARAVVKAAGAADDTINEGLMRLVQGDLFRVLVELKEADPEKIDVNSLARNVASICPLVGADAPGGRRNARRDRAAGARGRAQGGRGGAQRIARRIVGRGQKRIRAALLEIVEMPVAVGIDEASAAAYRLAGGGRERSSADEPAPIRIALPERESVGEKSGEARDD